MIYITVICDTVIKAIFIPESTGVDEVNEFECVAYSNQGKIFVEGAACKAIKVYDVNGRLMSEVDDANEIQEISIRVAGVYFVRINEKKSIKVVVK